MQGTQIWRRSAVPSLFHRQDSLPLHVVAGARRGLTSETLDGSLQRFGNPWSPPWLEHRQSVPISLHRYPVHVPRGCSSAFVSLGSPVDHCMCVLGGGVVYVLLERGGCEGLEKGGGGKEGREGGRQKQHVSADGNRFSQALKPPPILRRIFASQNHRLLQGHARCFGVLALLC